MTFLSSSEFAELAGITRRNATLALTRSLLGYEWKGHRLAVKRVAGQGGNSGTNYQVELSSLPSQFQQAWNEQKRPTPLRSIFSMTELFRFRAALVQFVISSGAKGTAQRSAAIREAFAAAKINGRKLSQRTILGWVRQFEGPGLPLLNRKQRTDRGRARVIAWRAWDQAMAAAGVAEADQRTIAAMIDADVRGFWAAGEVSAANIQFCMTVRCRGYAEQAGVTLPTLEMDRLCRVPLHYAGEKTRRRARSAHIKRNDAARWASHHVPRVKRHRNDLRPMDLVAADVRHSDILYRRADGSLATAKMVAFLDLATNRLFVRVFLLPAGEMIRREHVLLALRDLAADPSWGLWRGLYLDNGGEFSLGEAPDDLTHLANLVRMLHGDSVGSEYGNIISRPYNPQSKLIESTFSTLTRSVEPPNPGFIGSDRMAKKTQNQGRAPVPMEGTEAEIQTRYAEMVQFYNSKQQQKGHIKGRSPDEAYAAFVKDAARPWGAIVLNPREFSLAFGPDELRRVHPGGELHIDNRILVHPKLVTMVGEKVRVRLPILAPGRAVVLSDKGEPDFVAAEAEALSIRSLAGVRRHDAGRRAASAAATAASAGATTIDIAEARRASIAALPPPPSALPIATAMVHPVLRDEAARGPVAIQPKRGKCQDAAQSSNLRAVADEARARRRAG